MRVVQLGPYPPPHGGVQTNLVAIREYLRRQRPFMRCRQPDALPPRGRRWRVLPRRRDRADAAVVASAGRHSAPAFRRRSDPAIAGPGAVLHRCCPAARPCSRFIPADIRGRPRDRRRRRPRCADSFCAGCDGLIGVNRGNRRPVREVRRAPGTHPHDPAVCRAAAGSLAAATRAAGRVPQRAQSGAADGRPAGAGIRFADADRLHGRNSASNIRAPGC